MQCLSYRELTLSCDHADAPHQTARGLTHDERHDRVCTLRWACPGCNDERAHNLPGRDIFTKQVRHICCGALAVDRSHATP
eukprot:4333991-Alexandrium_andersonii.AAC.1